MSRRILSAVLTPLVAIASVTGLAACGGDDSPASPNAPVTLRVGHFPNLTHATPIVAAERGIFKENLGSNVTLEIKTFNAGPEAVEALLSGAIDATYIGPNPAVNAYQKSKGAAVRVVAGAASGGVAFVVKPGITKPEDLKGKKIATPQLGNTQDVALRYWLKEKGFKTTKDGGGDVAILPQANATSVEAYRSGAIDGAWIPEPFASQLVKAGGKVLLDERDLWPGGRFVITHLLVAKRFLDRNPTVIKNLIAGNVAANKWINANPADAQKTLSDGIQKLSGKPLDAALTAEAWKTLTFLDDPLASSLLVGADHAVQVGLLTKVDNLKGLYDLKLLNEVLAEQGLPESKV
jgi:NitT/TauT family transport system substrate-binding protein